MKRRKRMTNSWTLTPRLEFGRRKCRHEKEKSIDRIALAHVRALQCYAVLFGQHVFLSDSAQISSVINHEMRSEAKVCFFGSLNYLLCFLFRERWRTRQICGMFCNGFSSLKCRNSFPLLNTGCFKIVIIRVVLGQNIFFYPESLKNPGTWN